MTARSAIPTDKIEEFICLRLYVEKVGMPTPNPWASARGSIVRAPVLHAGAIEAPLLVRFVVVEPSELSGLVPVLLATLPSTVGVVLAFLIGRIVVDAAPLIGNVGINPALLDRGVDVALGQYRTSEGGQ